MFETQEILIKTDLSKNRTTIQIKNFHVVENAATVLKQAYEDLKTDAMKKHEAEILKQQTIDFAKHFLSHHFFDVNLLDGNYENMLECFYDDFFNDKK